VLLPALSVIGFGVVGFAPTLAVIVVFQVLRRAGEYAVAKPARELLFSVLDREQKYKAKNLIDTVVFRGGDMTSAWLLTGLKALGLTAVALAAAAIPVALVWLACPGCSANARKRWRGASGSVQSRKAATQWSPWKSGGRNGSSCEHGRSSATMALKLCVRIENTEECTVGNIQDA
jgi:AAA family ATP:ADP antiporter